VFGDLSSRKALVVGAGESARLAAENLRDRNVASMLIANRTLDRAVVLAEAVDGEAIAFDARMDLLSETDILVTATSAPDAIFDLSNVQSATRQRSRRPLLILDLAVPRDVDASVNRLDNVFLYDVDALKIMVEQNVRRREKEIPRVEGIIHEELAQFLAWYGSLAVTPLIRALRQQIEEIRREQIGRYGGQFAPEDRETLDQFTRTLVNRILHQPISRLRSFSADARWGAIRLDTVRELFGLEDAHDGSSDPDRNEIE